MGLTENPAGVYNWPQIPVPNDPLLYNNAFYDEAFWVDQSANALGVVASWSSQWVVRSGARPNGGRIYQYINNGNPTPGPNTGYSATEAPIAQFSY